jgi:intracellular sulfur oxidation DsrE/DsrF family protein
LLANLLPGVTPVPALIVAVNRAQESGLSYAYIG